VQGPEKGVQLQGQMSSGCCLFLPVPPELTAALGPTQPNARGDAGMAKGHRLMAGRAVVVVHARVPLHLGATAHGMS